MHQARDLEKGNTVVVSPQRDVVFVVGSVDPEQVDGPRVHHLDHPFLGGVSDEPVTGKVHLCDPTIVGVSEDEESDTPEEVDAEIYATIWQRIKDLGFNRNRIAAVIYDSRDGEDAEDYRESIHRIFRVHGYYLIVLVDIAPPAQ